MVTFSQYFLDKGVENPWDFSMHAIDVFQALQQLNSAGPLVVP